MKPFRILFSGYFGGGNLGDEAILSAELHRFRDALPGRLEPVVATWDEALTRSLHGEVATVPFRDTRAMSLAIAQSDLVVWGGGGLLQDHWHVPVEELLLDPPGGVPAYLRVPLLAAAWGRPCMVYGQGVGPLRAPENRRLVGLLLAGVDAIAVRDAASADLLRECGVGGCPIQTTADPVVSIRPAPAERGRDQIVRTGLVPGRGPLIAVIPRIPPDGDVSWVRPFAAALKEFGHEKGASVLFVPFDQGKEGDLRVCQELSEICSSSLPVGILGGWTTAEDVAATLGECDLTVATRLHGLYLSVLTGTPVIAIDYDPKVRAAAREFQPDIPVLSLSQLEGQVLGPVLAKTLAEAPALRPRLLAALETLRVRESGNIEIALALLSARPASGARDSASLLHARQRARLRVLERSNRELHEIVDPLRASASAARHEAEAARAVLANLWRRVERGEEAEERSRGLLDELSKARRENQLLQAARQELEARIADLCAQREALLGERAFLEREVNTLKGSRGVRLVMRYWSLANRFLPHGGPLGPLRRLIHGRREDSAPVLRDPHDAPPLIEPPLPLPHPDDLLLEFDELVRGGSGEKRGLVVLASGTCLDVDEGQRPTQLALELAAQGYLVVFAYWRWPGQELRRQDHLDRGILQIPIDLVFERFAHVLRRPPFRNPTLLICFPHVGLFEPIATARAEGWIVAYDAMDDWMEFSRVGQAVWYDQAFEEHLLKTVDAVFAVNEPLARHLRSLGCESPVVVPNGVSPSIADVDEERPLERGAVTVGYFGYLAGAWFDWDLVADAARSRPDWKFYLVGYGGGPEGLDLPSNVLLLGKKPQKQLAAFARNWDVAMIPFKAERLAAGADPIKTYEYLAMGLPVVTTGVFPPPGAERLVKRAADSEEFLALVERGAREKESGREERIAFAGRCTWRARTLQILKALDSDQNEKVKLQAALFGGPG